MTNPTDGGPAFPSDGKWGNDVPERGMSLRDWFAGQALAGLTTNGEGIAKGARGGVNIPSFLAKLSYEAADAMLAQRAKAEGGE